MQTQLANWTGPGVTLNNFPWFNSLLNVPNYTQANGWPDQCVTEPYHPIVIPYTGLCPGQVYYIAAREWVSGTNSVGPWTTPMSFTVPGTFVPLNFNIAATPTIFCSPGSSQLSVSNITGGCGQQSVTWQPGGMTSLTVNVSPAATTNYTAIVSTPCNTLSKVVTVSVVPSVNAAFNPLNGSGCVNVPVQFNHTGTSGVTHTWSAAPAGGVIISSVNAASPTITFPNTGNYTISHTVAAGSCTHVVSTNITINGVNPAFTIPSATQCLGGNSFNFNAVNTTGTHSYTFSPSGGAPPSGGTANYGPVAFTAAGTYTVTHTVTNSGCTSFTTAVVLVNPNPSLTVVPSNAICGNNNGSIVINNTSGAGQTVVSYSLNGSAIPSQTATNLGTGTYTVGLSNNFGCSTFTTTTINNTPGMTALNNSTVHPTCGLANGSIGMTGVVGGTPTYSYSLNGGAYTTATSFTGLTAGTYTVTVLDVNGCTFTKVITLINQPGPTALSFTTAPTACVGNTGQIGITGVTGGTAPYTFSVNGVTTGSVTGSLAAGSHVITVKDNNNCTYSTTAVVNTVAGPTAANIITQNAACGNANGSATVSSVTGGQPAYQYSFNGGAFSTSAIQTGLTAGPKNVVIMDANSCTLSVNFVIGNTGSPVSSIATLTNVSCFNGANGGFSVSTSGGTPGYSYTLTPGNVTNGFGSFTGLSAQAYTVTVKDAAGCVATVTTALTQPSQLSLSLSSLPTLCNGASNGTITASAGGGTSPYQYNLNGGAYQASNVFASNISAGAYNITVMDANGCTFSQTVAVTQPAPLTLTMSSQNAVCSAANGTAAVQVAGGTPVYSYTWFPSGGNSASANNVTSGNYTVTVKDNNNCTLTGAVTVSATPGGTAIISNISHVTCNGYNNGSLTAGMSGAFTAPLTYSWSNGSTLQTATGLAPGSYTVQITDFNGCKSSAVASITQPATITAVSAASGASCFQSATGSATTTVLSGGTPGYTYLWTPGSQTTGIVNGLPAGTYSCQVTDANGCTVVNTVTVTQPSSVTIVTNTNQATCNQSNGSASASASGGTAPYTYTWSTGATGANLNNVPAGTYTVQVQDNNGCLYALSATIPNAAGPSISITSQTNVSCFGGNNGVATTSVSGGTSGPGFPQYSWSNGQNTGTATNLSAGVYTVSVTDASGCVASTSLTITQPPALTVNVAGTNPKCFNATNGSANAGVLGGTAPYSYSWLPAPGAGGSSATPSGMGPGSYAVTVTDNMGCTATGTVALANPPQMLASVASTNVSCFNACNGMAAASTTNAVGIISYYYTGGPLPLSTQNVSNLCAGSYTMQATDQNSCTASVVFTIAQPAQLTVSIQAVGNVSCSGGNNGFATSAPNGGTTPYAYLWSNGQTNQTASGLSAGNYTITVTDAQNCSANANVTITQPSGLTVTATSTNVTCNGYSNGIGNVSYGGGTGIPSILWQPSLNTGQTATGLAPGIHTVTLNDANNCPASATISITQPAPLVITSLNNTSSNCGQANGSATVTASGGFGGLSYLWSSNPNFTLSTINNVVAGAYTVVVSDGNGCQTSAITTINDIAGPSISSQSSTSVICNGQANGTAGVVASGGVGTLSYQWSHLGQTTPTVTNLPGGLHSVTIMDGAGCVTSATFNIAQPTQVVSAIGSFTNVSCSGASNGGATALANGGMGGYSYLWMPSSQNSQVLSGAGPGIYTVTVSDINNCSSSSTVNISQPNPLLITTNTLVHVNCNGGATGQINTSITGGSPAYTISWNPNAGSNAIVTNLTAGSYSLTVTDQQGCSTSSVYVITQPSALTVLSSATTAATCGNANGTASVMISGGSSPYAYSWNTPNIQTSANASGLAPSVWMLTTTDSKGCTITHTVSVPAAPLPSVTAVSTSILCSGMNNGSASVSPSGAGPFNVTWSPGNMSGAMINGLGPAVYTATITDVNGCSTFTSVTITQPAPLVLNASPTQSLCYGQSTNVFGQASGGTAPYSYTLTNMSTSAGTSSTTPGGILSNVTLTTTTQYSISVVDANGCATADKFSLVNVAPPLLATGMSTATCDGYNVTLAPTITSPGAGAPYTYMWSNGASGYNNQVTASFNQSPQIFTVTIDDGCSMPKGQAVFTLNVNPAPSLTMTSSPNKGCAPLGVQFIASSDTPNSTYYWDLGGDSNGGGNVQVGSQAAHSYTNPGNYNISVTAVNQFGCSRNLTINNYVQVYPVPTADFEYDPAEITILEPRVHFTNLSAGASSYVWDFGDYSSLHNSSNLTHPVHVYDVAGSYYVYLVAINSFGCMDTAIKKIDVRPDVSVYIPNAFTPDGNGRNDVFQPKGVGINEDKYRMEIFDRWGELIFTSNNFKTGWDGTVKGSSVIAQDGVYIYKIFIVDLEGNKKYYTGHVTLLKQ
jgi:gliding motility-associated-like protein